MDEWTRITFDEDGTYTGAVGRIGRDSLPLLVKYDERILALTGCQDVKCATATTEQLLVGATNADVLVSSDAPPVISALRRGELAVVECKVDTCASRQTTMLRQFGYVGWRIARHRGDVVIAAVTPRDTYGVQRIDILRCKGADCSEPSINVAALAVRPVTLHIAVVRDVLSLIYTGESGEVGTYRCDGATCGTSSLSVLSRPRKLTIVGTALSPEGMLRLIVTVASSDEKQNSRYTDFIRCLDKACHASASIRLHPREAEWGRISIDAAGIPTVVWKEVAVPVLYLGRCDSAACERVTVAKLHQGPAYSVAFASNGAPAVFWPSGSNGVVKVTQCRDALCSDRTVSTFGSAD